MRGANGFPLACVYCRDDLHKAGWSFAHGRLTSDETRRIVAGIARLPELLGFRIGFYPHSSGTMWRVARPYHVALEDSYVRRHWDEIDLTCRLMEFPRGDRRAHPAQRPAVRLQVRSSAARDHVLHYDDFVFPERRDIPRMKRIKDFDEYQGRSNGPAMNKQAQLPQSGQRNQRAAHATRSANTVLCVA